jgi:hypothetical protein
LVPTNQGKSEVIIHANAKPDRRQTATYFIPALFDKKAGAVAGVDVCSFCWRLRPNMALNPDARLVALGLAGIVPGTPSSTDKAASY